MMGIIMAMLQKEVGQWIRASCSWCTILLKARWCLFRFFFFFYNDPAPTEIYPLPLHDALPILSVVVRPSHFVSSASALSACFRVSEEGDQPIGAGSEYFFGSTPHGMKRLRKRPNPSSVDCQCRCHQSPANSAVDSNRQRVSGEYGSVGRSAASSCSGFSHVASSVMCTHE